MLHPAALCDSIMSVEIGHILYLIERKYLVHTTLGVVQGGLYVQRVQGVVHRGCTQVLYAGLCAGVVRGCCLHKKCLHKKCFQQATPEIQDKLLAESKRLRSIWRAENM